MRGSGGETEKAGPVSVIGGSNIDILAKPKGVFSPGTSNPGTILKNAGGVGGNIARLLSLLQVHTEFYSVVGSDREGSYIIDSLQDAGVNTGGVLVTSKEKTGSYAALQDAEGTLIGAVSDMRATELLLPDVLNAHKEKLLQSSMIAADTNIPEASLVWLSELCRDNSIPFFIEPVSKEKARKILELPAAAQWISPSEAEFIELFQFPGKERGLLSENILITLGPRGVVHLALENKTSRRWRAKLYPPYRVEVKSDNGAGDAFFAGFIAALQHGNGEEKAIQYGLAAAAWVLQYPPEALGGLDFSKLSGYIESYEAEH